MQLYKVPYNNCAEPWHVPFVGFRLIDLREHEAAKIHTGEKLLFPERLVSSVTVHIHFPLRLPEPNQQNPSNNPHVAALPSVLNPAETESLVVRSNTNIYACSDG